MLINTAILKILDSKNLEDNRSSSILLKKIQENKQIVYENKIVDADKKKIKETLLGWLENEDLDIIIIINGIKTGEKNLTSKIFEELKENQTAAVRNIQEFSRLKHLEQKAEIGKSRSMFVQGVYIIEIPDSQEAITDSWNNILKVRYDINKITLNNYIKNLKVTPRHLEYGQLYDKRAIDMQKELGKQIEFYLSSLKQTIGKFIFVEVGSYLGESLEIWGDLFRF